MPKLKAALAFAVFANKLTTLMLGRGIRVIFTWMYAEGSMSKASKVQPEQLMEDKVQNVLQ